MEKGGNKQRKKKPFSSQIFENLFFQGFSGVLSKGGSLLFTIIIARILFPELFGIYSLALTIILILIAISDFGLSPSITFYLAESLGNKKKKQARSRFWFLINLKFFTSVIFSISLFLFAGVLAAFFKKPELILPLRIGSLYLFISAIYAVITPFFISIQKLKYTASSEAIFQVSRIFLVCVFFLFLKLEKSIFLIFVSLVLATLFSLIFVLVIIYKKYPFLIKGKKDPVEKRRILRFSGFLAAGSLGAIISLSIDKLVLGFFLESEFVGFYAAIFSIVGGVIGFVGITAVFFPVFVQLKGEKLKSFFTKSFHYLSILVFPASIGLAFVLPSLLKILYGAEYLPAQYKFSFIITAALLSLIILENAFSGFYKTLLDAKEMPKISAFINIATSILNVFLNVFFIYYLIKIDISYGLIGASAATFLSRYAGLFAIAFLAKKRTNISPKRSSVIKPFFASIIMLVYLFFFHHFFPMNLISGIIMIVSAAIFYFLILLLIKGLDINEVKSLLFKDSKDILGHKEFISSEKESN